jgi:3-dehydrotetronate 4-kinase
LVEDALADCALKACDMSFRRLVIADGETSGGISKALGISRLTIGKEIAPGVPWCFAETAGSAVAITLKSGNFGDENFFGKALEVLEATARLAMLTRNHHPRLLNTAEVQDIVTTFNVEWEA